MRNPLLDKKKLKHFKQKQGKLFRNRAPVVELIHALSDYTQTLVLDYWSQENLTLTNDLCLIALGSFAKKELFPYSDLDLLIICEKPQFQAKIENFIQALWDIGYKVGHQVTTLSEAVAFATQDLNFISSLMDMRFLASSRSLFDELNYKISISQMWESKQFYKAKWQEQQIRYQKFDSTAYNLEPNIKNGPGGLRDIQMILWISQRHFGERNLNECLYSRLITEEEYNTLYSCRLFLWQVRYALHLIAGAPEERLIFNYQKSLAELLGFSHSESNVAIEQFMKIFFQNIKRIRELNELLLQLFREIIFQQQPPQAQDINIYFQKINGFLEIKKTNAFRRHPQLLLKIFETRYADPTIKGIKATTMRLIRSHNYLIDSSFRRKRQNQKTFLRLLKLTPHTYDILKMMHRFGLLHRFIPEFGNISGQMQYDLFHVYTVDQHSLFVVNNIQIFGNNPVKYPLYHAIYQRIEKKYLLNIAALYHDIGKGHGGDHSLIGSQFVLKFCQLLGINERDANLCFFLVRHHLLMSHTAQRKDIDDPEIIEEFCSIVETERKLNYLYLLTIADICATNPKLWNSWKDVLLRNLYNKALNYFSVNKRTSPEAIITKAKQEALPLLKPLKKDTVLNLWQSLKDSYFLQNPPEIIAEQCRAILNSQSFPIILISPHHSGIGMQIFIYMPICSSRFSITTTLLSNLNLTIVEARISQCKNNFALDNYVILNENAQINISNKILEQLKQRLLNHLTPPISIPNQVQRSMPRRQKQMKLKPYVSFSRDRKKNRTELLLVTIDRSGLLASLSLIFAKQDIDVQNAKISTSGEQVEDVFFISYQNTYLDHEKQTSLKKEIYDLLWP